MKNVLVFLTALSTMILTLGAQAQSTGADANKITNCKVTYDKGLYEGSCRNGVAHGTGVFNWSNGDRYEGEFVGGQRSGRGTLYYKSGDKFTGPFTKDQVSGTGTYVWKNGTTQQGSFAADGKWLASAEPVFAQQTKAAAAPSPSSGMAKDSQTNNNSPIESCKSAVVPNPNPMFQETTEFYGECRDGKGITGVVVWKQAGQPYDLNCLVDGAYGDGEFERKIEYHDDSSCMKYLKYMPNYCRVGNWAGQCKDGNASGLGVMQWTGGGSGWLYNYHTYIGQAQNGKFSGYGKKRTTYKCGMLGCTGGYDTEAGWWSNGDFVMTCAGGPLGCQSALGAREKYDAAQRLEKDLKCEEALNIDRAAQKADGQKHSDTEQQNGLKISYSSCTAERKFQNTMNGKDPQAMYLAAGQYARNSESYRATQLYEKIIDRFPSSPWAVKANDQLNADKRVNDAESSARQRQYEEQSARDEATRREKSECSLRISKCNDSCSPLKGSAKQSCWDHCQSLCSQF